MSIWYLGTYLDICHDFTHCLDNVLVADMICKKKQVPTIHLGSIYLIFILNNAHTDDQVPIADEVAEHEMASFMDADKI